jgi:hypothetical protein
MGEIDDASSLNSRATGALGLGFGKKGREGDDTSKYDGD